MLRRAAIVLAVGLLAVTVVASPTLAGKKTYSVDVDGDVNSASFVTPGNNSATRLNPGPKQPIDVVLNLTGIGISDRSDHLGVCGDPIPQELDDVEWRFHNLSFSKSGSLELRFRLGFSDGCGFDDYELIISFDTGGASGPDYVTSDAHIEIHHYAETADPTNRGNKRISHTSDCCDTPFFETDDGLVTITIAEL